MRILALLIGGIAAASMLGPPTRAATTFTMTYTGTMLSGSDPAGIFGAAGASLADDPFSIVYTYQSGVGGTPGDEFGGMVVWVRRRRFFLSL